MFAHSGYSVGAAAYRNERTQTPLFPKSYGRLVSVGDVPGLPGRGVRAVHQSDGRVVPHARDLVRDDECSWDLPYGQARSGRSRSLYPAPQPLELEGDLSGVV